MSRAEPPRARLLKSKADINRNNGKSVMEASTSDAETKAVNLHAALSRLVEDYRELVKDTNSEPTFGEPEAIVKAERALFENRPLADWETRSETGQIALWMISKGYATGHGDTVESLLFELELQAKERAFESVRMGVKDAAAPARK